MSTIMESDAQSDADMSIVVVGDQRAGKTSLITSLCHGLFSQEYAATVGVDYNCRLLDVDGKNVRLHMWDTSGQESFLWVAKGHIKKADAFVLVYDVTDPDSFASVPRWIQLVNRVASARDLPKLLVGSKLDLRHRQVVSCSKAKEFAIPNGYEHMEVSSSSGKNVNAAFYVLANKVLRYRKLGCGNRLGVGNPVVSFPDIQVHEDPSGMPQDSADYTHLFKILLLGDCRSGKTALRFRFCKSHYSPDYLATTGFEYSTRTVQLDDERLKLQIWDVSGDQVYEQMRRGYYRGANAFLIVYDITKSASFANVEHLLKELSFHGQSDCPKIVVGNKTDVGHKRKVDYSDAIEWADGWRVPLMETSCKNAANVDSAFLKLAVALRHQMAPWNRVYNFTP